MPPLPKQNKKLEGDFGVWLKNYTEKHPHLVTTGLECKQTTTDSIPFSVVTPQQVAFGMGAKSSKGVWIRVQGLNGEMDYIFMVNSPSYIVIRYPSIVCWIDIETLILERDRSKRKSLTSQRASEISIRTIKL
jgi:hypothetical protein